MPERLPHMYYFEDGTLAWQLIATTLSRFILRSILHSGDGRKCGGEIRRRAREPG